MAKESIWVGIWVGIAIAVIGGILLMILGNPIQDIMTPPQVILVAQYNEKVCPANLYFQSYGDKTASFSVKLQNIGDDGTIFVTTYSDKLLNRASDGEEFKPNSTKQWFVNSKQYQDFNFVLREKEDADNLENVTVSFNYGCYEEVIGNNFYCKQYTRCCNYQNQKYGQGYKLLNQICS